MGRELSALRQYDGPARRFAQAQITLQVVGVLPKFAMEVLAAGLILVLAVLLTATAGRPVEDIAPTLALYAFAAQRLLPFMQELQCLARRRRGLI